MNALNYYQLLQKNAQAMGGVFSVNDLRNLFSQSNSTVLYRIVNKPEQEKVLFRFRQFFCYK